MGSSLFELRGVLNSIEFNLVLLKKSIQDGKLKKSLEHFKTELNRQKVKLGKYTSIEFRKKNKNSQDIANIVKTLAKLCEFLESKQDKFTEEDYIRTSIIERSIELIEELTQYNHLEEKHYYI